jgi:hypothetical protein
MATASVPAMYDKNTTLVGRLNSDPGNSELSYYLLCN